MPLGKYYCDYCDKEFQDTPIARKRHLQSSFHLRAKSLWYRSVYSSDSNQSYVHAAGAKGVCNRFVNKGYCPFGNSCRYLHPCNSSNYNVNATLGFFGNAQPPIILGSQLVGGSSLPGDIERTSIGLPPSLNPPPEGGYPPLPFVDWG